MKKLLTLLLLCSLILPAFAACSTENAYDNSADTTDAEATAAETTAVETEPTPYAYLEKEDYDGYGFRVYCPVAATKLFPGVIIPEEQTGDIVYDAAYERNQYVEEYFNCDMVLIDVGDAAQSAEKTRAGVLAGEDICDMLMTSVQYAGTLAYEGLLLDMNTIDAMHTDMPWYSVKANENIEINGILPMAATNYTISFLGNTYIYTFNSKMADEFHIPDMYEAVLEGKWTHDLMVENAKVVTADLNGDGILDKADRYGFGIASSIAWYADPMIMQQYGMGVFTTQKNADGIPELALNSERAVNIAEKLKLLYTDECTFKAYASWSEPAVHFKNGGSLFVVLVIAQIMNDFRDMEDDYGVLPMPKYDEAQEEYYTSVSIASTQLEAIPLTVSDPERTGTIYEALIYEGYKRVIPAFYETSMKVKFSRDDMTAQVFDIIRDSVVVDFGLIYDNGIKMMNLTGYVVAGGEEYMSAYASRESAAKAQYEMILKAFEK